MRKGPPAMLNERRRYEKWNIILVLICLFLAFVLLFDIYVAVNYEVVLVDGESMCNTLQDGDILYVDPDRKAERGDIIIIDVEKYRERDGWSGDYLIKRLIATEGDALYAENGSVWIRYAGEEDFIQLSEPYVRSFTPDFEEVTVGEGEIYFMGDNRVYSKDSRSALVGSIYVEDIEGVVMEWSVSVKGAIKGWVTFRGWLGLN